MKTLISLGLLGLLLTTAALAGDVEDVTAAEMDSRVQEMAGNVDGYFKYKGSTYTIFPPTGGFLSTGSRREQAQARFDAGMKFDMTTRNYDVKIYGDTAVATYYTVGTVQRSAESEPEWWNLRMTSVWVKEAGQWKLAHRHESHLALR